MGVTTAATAATGTRPWRRARPSDFHGCSSAESVIEQGRASLNVVLTCAESVCLSNAAGSSLLYLRISRSEPDVHKNDLY